MNRRRQNRRRLTVVLAIALPVVVFGALACAALLGAVRVGGMENLSRVYRSSTADSLTTIWALIANETSYAKSYDEGKFWLVATGMREDEVLALLGDPRTRIEMRIASGDVHTVIWNYADKAAQHTPYYFERSVIFGRSGVVEGKSAYLACSPTR